MNHFKRRIVDKVVDFESTEGDEIVLADDVFVGLIEFPILPLVILIRILSSNRTMVANNFIFNQSSSFVLTSVSIPKVLARSLTTE